MAKKVYLRNTTMSDLKIKINDDVVDDNDDVVDGDGVHFLDGAKQDTNLEPTISDNAVDRDRRGGPNQFGDRENILYIYRDVIRDESLTEADVEPIELKVYINNKKLQLNEDLVIYIFFSRGTFGYVLLNDEGDVLEFVDPRIRVVYDARDGD